MVAAANIMYAATKPKATTGEIAALPDTLAIAISATKIPSRKIPIRVARFLDAIMHCAP
ncbi:MAG: hypothetical protein OHK0023_12670 [Anaerolineae bacterium]